MPNLFFVLNGCKTWSLTAREEHGLRMSMKRVRRRIFGPKTEEMVGGRRRLNNEELHNLYASPCIIRVIKSRRIRWTEHVARTKEMRNA